MFEKFKTNYAIVDSSEKNKFRPSNQDYFAGSGKRLAFISNPNNPTGITRYGDELKELIKMGSQPNNGLLMDEAYEMFHSPPCSAM